VHVDLVFDDPAPVAARVVELGGSILRRDGFLVYTRLPPWGRFR
jgi:hypothetical protein